MDITAKHILDGDLSWREPYDNGHDHGFGKAWRMTTYRNPPPKKPDDSEHKHSEPSA